MHVAAINRFPVKSFQGEALEAAEVDAAGVVGDRRWALVDPATGQALSAKREARLLDAAARTTSGGIVVRLPDGTEGRPGDPALDKAASAWLDREVRFEQADPAAPRAYEMNVSSEDEASPLVEIGCPPGTFMDFAAVHVLTTASLRAIAALRPESRWDLARFRPTVLVEADGDEFVEDAWVGTPLTIGGATLQPFMPTVRCVITARAQAAHGLPRDLDVAKTVNREHGGSLGLYCAVAVPGPVAVGDAVSVG